MPFEYKDHTGETWLSATGESLEEAFSEGAKALFNIMVPIEQIEPCEEVDVSCSAGELDMLFFEWLNRLIVIKEIQGLIFSRFEIFLIKKQKREYQLNAKIWGEAFDSSKHESEVDVKAATFSELKCEKTTDGYLVECVIDI
ncbi:archease [Candidatus Acetothermia bacterium]|nr:archease [Candidatus Acetothermia bacterium]MBI3643317.1 archease [Candidatus Acetothermia bacterium]